MRGSSPSGAVSSGLIGALPALVFALSAVVLSWGEYYAITTLAVGAAFWGLCFALGIRIPAKVHASQGRIGYLLFRNCLQAWILSLLLLAVLNVTPLCVGQDNGDGTNSVGECFIYTAVSSATYSFLVVALAAVTAVAAAPSWRAC